MLPIPGCSYDTIPHSHSRGSMEEAYLHVPKSSRDLVRCMQSDPVSYETPGGILRKSPEEWS